LGLFVSLTSSFKASTKLSVDADYVTREIRPLYSTGVFFSPLPYLQLLVGFTQSHVAADNMGDHRLFSPFLGLATSVDAVGKLFGQ